MKGENGLSILSLRILLTPVNDSGKSLLNQQDKFGAPDATTLMQIIENFGSVSNGANSRKQSGFTLNEFALHCVVVTAAMLVFRRRLLR